MEVKEISKQFGGLKALDECTLKVEKEKVTAIIGPNGSGKSTLFNVISQIIKQDGGEIIHKGIKLSELPDFKVAQAGIARTFQEVRLFKNLTIRDHLEIAMSEKNEELFANLFNKKRIAKKRIEEILAIVGLDKSLDTLATDLSYGQRKLLDLAVAIAKPHEILMLDEPVAGVNPKLRTEIKKILKELQKKGETILVIEHDMNFVMGLANYVYVLDHGSVIAHGSPRKIQKDKKVLEAYLGE